MDFPLSPVDYTGANRILDIDTETKPGHWIGGDYVSKAFTAVAWKWVNEGDKVQVYTHYDMSPGTLALLLAQQIRQADVVVGHWLRGADLPWVNGNLMTLKGKERVPLIRNVLTHDTKSDLVKSGGRSLSQRNLAAQIGIASAKVEVTLPDWEAFNFKDPGEKQVGIERVVGDVVQNEEMYLKLLELGWLLPPRVWSADKAAAAKYTP